MQDRIDVNQLKAVLLRGGIIDAILQKSDFTKDTKLILIAYAVFSEGRQFRRFLDFFYGTFVKHQMLGFANYCYYLKCLNDLSANNLIAKGKYDQTPDNAINVHFGNNLQHQQVEKLQTLMVDLLLDYLPTVQGNVDLSELKELLTDVTVDVSWRKLPIMRLTTKQIAEVS